MLPRKAKPDSVSCFVRPYPSGNFALVHGPRPILIDSGFGSDAETTLRLVEDAGAHPRDLQCLANTHYHAAHAGGNAAFQRERTRIAAHRHDAMMVNAADRESCAADYLGQLIEQYAVDIFLEPGTILETGTLRVHVLGTPGHTLGHLSYLAEDGTLIAGDLLGEDGATWVNTFREGSGAIYRMIDSLQTLTDPIVPIKRILPGHGALITDPQDAISRALDQLEGWLTDPQAAARSACKQIALFWLMIKDEHPRVDVQHDLQNSPWLYDYAKHIFDADPADFAAALIDDLLKSGSAAQAGAFIYATAPYTQHNGLWSDGVPPVSAWRPKG